MPPRKSRSSTAICPRWSTRRRRSRPGAEQLYPEIPGNLCFDYEYGDEAGTDSAFAQAAHVTRITLDSKRMVGNPMEPKACLAAYDAASDKYDLYVSSQGLSLMRGSADRKSV